MDGGTGERSVMKIAVMSDTHDHLANLEAAIGRINGYGADMLCHCGDLCSPFVIERLAAFEGPVHVVFGNNEGDRFTIERVAERFANVRLHGEVGFVEIPEGTIAITHRPEFAFGLASTGSYLAVFFGHTHRRERRTVCNTTLLNPGELMGLRETPGWIVFDTETGVEEIFTVGEETA